MAPVTLVGPPELYARKPTYADMVASTQTDTRTIAANNPFIDQMVANFNSLGTTRNPPMGFTENMSPTFLST
ncbi:plant/T31B5-30 protein, partial [Trifolium medium]|nr:plant/T31B5-30 protein [Trifolium medium]